MLANLAWSGCAVVRSDNATEPYLGPRRGQQRGRPQHHAPAPLQLRQQRRHRRRGRLAPRQRAHCPGRKPPFLYVKRPARPYKSPSQCIMDNDINRLRRGAAPADL